MNRYCNNSACPAAEGCSYAILYNKVSAKEDFLLTVNQKSLIIDNEGKCQQFRAPQHVTVAYGFKASTEMMPKRLYADFCRILIHEFNRTDFYAMRRGEQPIYPDRQEKILAVCASLGYTLPDSFWDTTKEEVVY